MKNRKQPVLKVIAGHRKPPTAGRSADWGPGTRFRAAVRVAEPIPSPAQPDQRASVDITTLFASWEVLQILLRRATLPDDVTDRFVDRSREIIMAIGRIAAADWSDVVLKLALYRQELRAGPGEECDALLASALQDCEPIFRRGEHLDAVPTVLGLAAAAAREHRPGSAPEHPIVSDTSHTR